MRRAATRPTQLLAALAAMILICGCDAQPAQDYVLTGTIEIDPKLGVDLETLRARGGEATLIMTVRSSPALEDVIIQRQWENVGPRHQFGLGKGRGAEIAARHDRLWVTAFLSVAPRQGRNVRRENFVGWTAEPVAPGTTFMTLRLDRRLFEVTGDDVGAPQGGWFSPAVAEEAAPPQNRPLVPGRRIFSGTADVDEPVRRLFQGATLIVAARKSPDDPEGELRATYYLPTFPLGFALHAQHTASGAPADVEEPRHLVAWLDLDGDLATTDDQARAATPAPVAPGESGVVLKIDARKVAERIAGMIGGSETPAAAARTVASGVVTVADAASLPADGALWVVVRSLPDNRLLLAKRMERGAFPLRFEIAETDSITGSVARVEGSFRVGAMLIDGDPARPTGPPWRALSAPIQEVGATGLELRLERD